MTRRYVTLSGLARVVGSMALVACLAGIMSARTATASAAPARWAPGFAPVGLERGGGRDAAVADQPRRGATDALAPDGQPGRLAFQGRGAWATLPAGLRAELAYMHLRIGVAGGTRRSDGWVRGMRRPRPFAVRPACQCGGGGATWSQQAALGDPNGASADNYGWSVALNSTGTIALIGAPYLNNYTGAAYVFVNTGGSWLEAAALTASDGARGDDFGHSVALSSDGSTLLIGAVGKNSYTGAAYVFTPLPYFGYGQRAELSAWDGATYDQFGTAVALSSDGSTALIGAPGKNSKTGAAYAFVGSGSTWVQEPDVTTSDGVAYDGFGAAVALSSDGNTALIGAPSKQNGTGAAYLFGRNGGTWNQQARLIDLYYTPGDGFGGAVSLSSDGSSALIGSPGWYNGTGAAYVFGGSGAVWSQQAMLTAADGAFNDGFGDAVALSSDGSTALIGAPNKNSEAGAAYVFQYILQGSGRIWVKEQDLSAADGGYFGCSTALSSDGTTLLIGAPYMLDYYRQVSAYIFTASAAPAPTATPTNTPLPPTSTPTATPVPPANTPTSTPRPAPSLVSSLSSASPYRTVTLTGTNFAAAEPVKLFWDSTASAPLTTVTALAGGSFVTQVTVPQAPAGAHTLYAVGQSSARSASASLTLKPAIVLSPTHGKAGSGATLLGVGFGAGETVAALWYPGLTPLKSGPANALGTVTLTVTVPLSPTGSYPLLGYGLTTKQYAAASFALTP